jgi:hypothetical protein
VQTHKRRFNSVQQPRSLISSPTSPDIDPGQFTTTSVNLENSATMPKLCDINYSRNACIAAITDYYEFLTKLYLDESFVLKPPPQGWPMEPDALRELGKSTHIPVLLYRSAIVLHAVGSFGPVALTSRGPS